MIELDDAWTQLRATLPVPKREERLPLDAALGRILSETPQATHAVPPFPASAMDGYARRAAELAELGKEGLAVIGTAWAGKPWSDVLPPRHLRAHLHPRAGAARLRQCPAARGITSRRGSHLRRAQA